MNRTACPGTRAGCRKKKRNRNHDTGRAGHQPISDDTAVERADELRMARSRVRARVRTGTRTCLAMSTVNSLRLPCDGKMLIANTVYRTNGSRGRRSENWDPPFDRRPIPTADCAPGSRCGEGQSYLNGPVCPLQNGCCCSQQHAGRKARWEETRLSAGALSSNLRPIRQDIQDWQTSNASESLLIISRCFVVRLGQRARKARSCCWRSLGCNRDVEAPDEHLPVRNSRRFHTHLVSAHLDTETGTATSAKRCCLRVSVVGLCSNHRDSPELFVVDFARLNKIVKGPLT